MSIILYLDVDTVIDVRYGKLCQINPKLADEVLFKFGQYCNRDHDDMWLMFPELTKEEWVNQPTTKESLMLGKRTNIFNLIDDVLRSMEGSLTTDIALELCINFKDYGLTTNEIEQFLVIISARYEHKFKVKAVTVPLKELTPSWLVKNTNIVIMYDFNGWVDLHSGKLGNQEVKGLTFYIPTLFRDKVAAERGFYEQLKHIDIEGEKLEVLSDYVWETYRMNIYFTSNKFYSPIALS